VSDIRDAYWMAQALDLAHQAAEQGEVPVGAVLVVGGECIAKAYNQPITQHDPCAHAEVFVLRQAGARLKNYRLTDATLYVTLEPCAMCVGAMVHARIQRLVYGASDPKTGAVSGAVPWLNAPHFNHRIAVGEPCLVDESRQLLQSFFKKRR
jgi:tRNA(adenine34) deaminase